MKTIFALHILLFCGTFAMALQTEAEPAMADGAIDLDQPNSSENCEVVRTVKETNDNVENLERTVKCTCQTGMIAGTTREKPACVLEYIFERSSWCDMNPCLENETCEVLEDRSGWLCDDGARTKTVVIKKEPKESTEDENQLD